MDLFGYSGLPTLGKSGETSAPVVKTMAHQVADSVNIFATSVMNSILSIGF
jgi:hypothetical protein